MNLTSFRRVTAGAILLQLVVAAWGLVQVGPWTSVPMHWGPTGEADRFAPAIVAFPAMPVVTALVAVLLGVVPRVEPRRTNLLRSADAYRTVAVATVVVLTAIQGFAVASGVGIDLPVARVVGLTVGALLAVTGNVLGTVRSNFMFGIRTPWTLASDRSWDRTQRLVGRLLVAGGLLVMASALLLGDVAVVATLLGVVAVVLVVSVGYSYRAWRADPGRRESETPR